VIANIMLCPMILTCCKLDADSKLFRLMLLCFVATGRGVQEGGPCSSHGISCCHLGSVCLE